MSSTIYLVIAAAASLALAFLGFIVTFRPLTLRGKRRAVIAFVLVGLLGIVCVWRAGVSADRQQAKAGEEQLSLQSKIDDLHEEQAATTRELAVVKKQTAPLATVPLLVQIVNLDAIAGQAAEPKTLPVQGIRFTQEVVPSSNKDAPHAVRVSIQTNVTTMPTAIMVICDNPLASGEWRLSGVIMTVGKYEGFTEDRKGYFIGLKETPFKPETPIVATLTASEPLQVLSVEGVPWP